MNQTLLDTYADLVIRKGIHLKKNKNVVIMTGPGTYYLARALSKSAYRHGALYVQVLLDDLDVLATRLDNLPSSAPWTMKCVQRAGPISELTALKNALTTLP